MARRRLENTNEAIQMLRDGFEPREIRRKFSGISPGVLHYWTCRLGLIFKKGRRKQSASDRVKQILAFRRRNSGVKTGQRFGISKARVSDVIKRYAPDEKFPDFRFEFGEKS